MTMTSAVGAAALLVAALSLAACNEEARQRAGYLADVRVSGDGRPVKGAYPGVPGTELDDATRSRLRARVVTQQF